jgi:hypothetical protein
MCFGKFRAQSCANAHSVSRARPSGRMTGDRMDVPRPHLSLVPGAPGVAMPARRSAARTRGGRDRSSWSAPTAPSEGTVRARVLAITDRCWQCRTKVRAVVGVLVDPANTPDGSGFLPLEDVAERLVEALDTRTLAGRRIGSIRHRESPGVVGGYVANGCIECDALIGRFALEDALNEHLVAGGTHAQLDVGIAVDLAAAAPARLRSIV